MKTTSILFAIAVAFSLSATTVFSAEKKKPAPKPPEPATKSDEAKKEAAKRDSYPFYGVVVSATDSVLTIKGGEGKPDHKYAITKETKIHDADKDATIKDVKEGKWVGGLLKKAEKGNDVVVNLNVGAKQKEVKKTEEGKPEPTTPPKKKKKAA